MSWDDSATALLAFVGLYPVVTAGFWIAGALVFGIDADHSEEDAPAGELPGVTIVISAYNEEAVVGSCVETVLGSDYPLIEVLLFDDGSADDTAAVAAVAAAGDPRLHIVRDDVNKGKAARLNAGFAAATYDLVLVTDADTNLDPRAVRLLVARISSTPLLAAVAAAPHVTNRRNLLSVMQVLEAASIIGLIRRTQAVAGSVGVIAGVLGIYRRRAVLEVGGYDPAMATEDIDLTWRLLLGGWHTTYEPEALVGMEVPSSLRALWAQRRRWARGQGEVLRAHLLSTLRWRHRRLWPVVLEAVLSLIWVVALVIAVGATAVALSGNADVPGVLLAFAWGIAVSVVATLQLAFALEIDFRHDRRAALAFVLAPIYPVAYWTISALAALREELPALLRGPRKDPVSWDIPRDLHRAE